jgi:adenosylcobinamide-phosphate synthase
MLISSAPDPFLVLLLALMIDLAFGDMERVFRLLPHPVAIAGDAIGFFDKRLNRADRSDRARRLRGVITVIVLVGAAAVVGWAAAGYLRIVHFGLAIEALLVAVLLAQRSLFEHVAAVARALQENGLDAGQRAVVKIIGRDRENLDEHGVARAAIEALFEKFSDGVVAPVVWYLLLGLPGIFAFKTVRTLDGMIGHRSPKYLQFGWAAARLDDILNWAPARVSTLVICAAALALPDARAGHGFSAMLKDARRHRSPNAGWPEAAAAGALGLALGGPRSDGGTIAPEPWLGDGRARATIADLAAALKLYLAAAACLAVLLLGGAAARQFL